LGLWQYQGAVVVPAKLEGAMTVAKVNSELMAAGAKFKTFEASACRNSASDLNEARQLQDDLTALRNQLELLNSAILEQIGALVSKNPMAIYGAGEMVTTTGDSKIVRS
jgi:hypothetical protein